MRYVGAGHPPCCAAMFLQSPRTDKTDSREGLLRFYLRWHLGFGGAIWETKKEEDSVDAGAG